ncbi:MAG: YcjF family protein, partial [Lautropia sp.]
LRNAGETAFLERLATALGLDARATVPALADADALATVALDSGDVTGAASDAPAPAEADPIAVADAQQVAIDVDAVAAAEVAGGKVDIGTADSGRLAVPAGAAGGRDTAGPQDAAVDRMILNAAIMNGALELLPQSLASLAIIPLQMKLVYRIGKTHGYDLDRGHVKDLLATLGVGVTGQYLEDIGRRLLGGLLGKAGGGLLGGLGRGATGMAFSFATTWAIGQVARRYYAGGRTLSTAALKDAFGTLFEEAKALQTRYVPQIEAQSRRIDVGKLVELVKSR